MRILTSDTADLVLHNAARLLGGKLEEKWGSLPAGDITLDPEAKLGAEEYRIRRDPAGAITVESGGAAGVLYGCGRLLREARIREGKLELPADEISDRPEHRTRGIYCATHFYNYYHTAPLEQVQAYIEELALWGVNALFVWFDLHHFQGIDDPEAIELLARLRGMIETARGVGMQAGLAMLANEGYANSSAELRADQRQIKTAVYGTELCPGKPEGLCTILRQAGEVMDQFDTLDFLVLWPYDQGGCGCVKCWPWGAQGFLQAGEKIADLYCSRWPAGKVILSTWLFDWPTHGRVGEWEHLYRTMEGGLEWVDVVLADGHERFPEAPLRRPLPHATPLVTFPEISMLGMGPWGAYGVNPLPTHWQGLWDQVGGHIAGSFPYSEGIYEDLNKVVWAQLNWQGSQPVTEIMRAYAAAEFSLECADDIARALTLMERTHTHRYQEQEGCIDAPNLSAAGEIWEIISTADHQLPSQARAGWRWRLVYLRALIDHELSASGGTPTDAVRDAFAELSQLYHADDRTEAWVRPPVMYANC
ncbi:MAG TPA: hypothetical protein VGM23_03280 [Armatimonadota bacterium]|jgi:hypothetical protein